MQKTLIEKTEFTTTYELKEVAVFPNTEPLVEELNKYFEQNSIDISFYKLSHIEWEVKHGSSQIEYAKLHLVRTGFIGQEEPLNDYEVYIDEDFEDDQEFIDFLGHLQERYGCVFKVPYYYYSK